MRRLIIFLIILVVSVWFGLVAIHHPGYLLLSYQPWVVQMPIWFAALSALMLFGLLYLLVNSIDQLHFVLFKIQNWLRFRREHQSYSKTQHGLALLIEGRWQKAERLLIAGAKQSIEPLMNYLSAAKAACEQKAFERCEGYIKQAYVVAPNADLAIGLTQAELDISQNHFEQAVATLRRLLKNSPRHPRVLTLLEKVYVRLADWESLQALLPTMRKARIINAEQTEQFEKNLYSELLQTSKKDLQEVQKLWDSIPRYLKRHPDLVYAYVNQLLQCGVSFAKETSQTREIEELIRKALKQSWQPQLAEIYSTLPFTNLNRQLVIAGAWLKLYGQQPVLLLLLGKLCVQVQLWGKAKDYFDKCLSLGPNPEASLEYGKLLQELGEEDAAVERYKDGLSSQCL